MIRLTNILLVSALACAPVTWAQTPSPAANKTTAKTSAGTEVSPPRQSTTEENCGCESQVLPEALAIVNGVRISRQELEGQVREPRLRLQRQVTEARKHELDLQINSQLVAMEAKRRSLSVSKLLEEEVVNKVKEPTEAEAQVFYDQNKTQIEGDFKDLKLNIVRYLREERQHDEALKFAKRLRSVIDTKVLVPEATPPQTASDRARVFAAVNGQQITSAQIEDSLRPLILEVQQKVYKLRQDELDLRINDALLEQEAQKRKITTNALLAAEVKPPVITEETARAFYEQNKERVSGDFTQTRDHIIRYLQQDELHKAELAFVEKLRRAASIQTFLIAPPSPIADALKAVPDKPETTVK